ncbi:MAG: hypothetical protein JRJ19_01070 [Deltaproteobacteria bacterium]|nr:hypothetical protein [Deltaproteobacteria bacterium]
MDPTRASDNDIHDYMRILKEDPRSRVFAPLADALVQKGKLKAAEQVCRMGLEVNPEFSDGHLAYARVLLKMKRFAEAFREVKTTVKLSPNNAEAYITAAKIGMLSGQTEAASQACMRAMDLDPENVEARQLLKRIGKTNQAAIDNQPVERVAVTTNEFRASAGTSPSRRISPEGVAPASLFGDSLAEASHDAIEKVDGSEQPFAAMSSGSQPPISDFKPIDEFDVPTKPSRPRPPQEVNSAVVPELPNHPQPAAQAKAPAGGPEDLLDMVGQVPAPAQAASPAPVPARARKAIAAPSAQSAQVLQTPTGGISSATIDRVQTVIDCYSDKIVPTNYDDFPLKVRRSGLIRLFVGLVVVIGALVGLFVLGTKTDKDKHASVDQNTLVKKSGIVLPQDSEVPPLPPVTDEPNTEPSVTNEPSTEPAATDKAAAEMPAGDEDKPIEPVAPDKPAEETNTLLVEENGKKAELDKAAPKPPKKKAVKKRKKRRRRKKTKRRKKSTKRRKRRRTKR